MNYNDYEKYYYENGNISLEEYYLNNKLHRTDGPAYILYYENGNIKAEYYYLNSNYHRTNGPAKIYYYDNGNIKSKYYYFNDKIIDVNSDEEFEKYVKHLILKWIIMIIKSLTMKMEI